MDRQTRVPGSGESWLSREVDDWRMGTSEVDFLVFSKFLYPPLRLPDMGSKVNKQAVIGYTNHLTFLRSSGRLDR